jgi:2-phosphoglycerate kinase
MIGTSGSIDRLVKENVSAVIDGVSLIPGTLADRYFEIANIVWIVVSINDEKIHYQRLGKRNETGVSRGGAKRYRQKIKVIRNNHDQLVSMGNKSSAFVVDNSHTLSTALDAVLQHIKTPYGDRGIPTTDPLRDKACQSLKNRSTKISQKTL